MFCHKPLSARIEAELSNGAGLFSASPIAADSIDGTEAKDVTLPRRTGPIVMTGEAYLKHFALPNFFFHATTAYNILRSNGVSVGKVDFLGG